MIVLKEFNERHLRNNTDWNDLPVACKGTTEQCYDYARDNGYEFVQDATVFGGYFKNSAGDCLVPDLPDSE